MIEVAAPCNLFADGNNADTLGCRHHIARVQNGFRPGMFYVDFSFNHRHTRAFRAGIYGENSSGDGYRAIRSTHVKVPGATPRRLHDDAPLVEMNGGVATRGGHCQFRALIHFHLGALEEPHLGTGIGARANELTRSDFVTRLQCALARGANEIRLPFDGIDPRAAARRACEVPIAPGPDQGNQQDH